MVGMMAAGLWVIVDPVGTVGALAHGPTRRRSAPWRTAAEGSPEHAARALGASLETVFSAAIEGPWCYLEFGDVEWCRQPARLDPRLRRAGLQIAAEEQALLGCHTGASALTPCAAPGSEAASALRRSVQLLREAQTNGAIFLALPANGPARNSINDERSLLRTICQSGQATSCHGPSAAQAEFRTNGGTWSRVGGLVLILVGLLGMLLLLGFLALRLLAAAIFTLLYLLLAPAMVLAPAFGDGGRAVFRRWSGQMLGSVVAKLVYSFLLGIVLAVLGLLASLAELGWWTQWLLMSTLWWGAFLRRHQALGVTGAVMGGERAGPRTAARRSSTLLRAGGGIAAARWARGRLGRHREATDRGVEPPRPPGEPVVRRALERLKSTAPDPRAPKREERQGAAATAPVQGVAGGHASEEVSSAHRGAQLARIEHARAQAVAAGDDRRAARLSHRAKRVAGELGTHIGAAGEHRAGERVGRRDAPARGAASQPEGRGPGTGAAQPGLAHAHGAVPSAPSAAAREALDRDLDARPARRGAESEVMRDAREVEAGRKRQLGRDRL